MLPPPTIPLPTPLQLTPPIPAVCLTCTSSLPSHQAPSHKERPPICRPATESKRDRRQREEGFPVGELMIVARHRPRTISYSCGFTAHFFPSVIFANLSSASAATLWFMWSIVDQVLRYQTCWDYRWWLGNVSIGLCAKTQLLPQKGYPKRNQQWTWSSYSVGTWEYAFVHKVKMQSCHFNGCMCLIFLFGSVDFSISVHLSWEKMVLDARDKWFLKEYDTVGKDLFS